MVLFYFVKEGYATTYLLISFLELSPLDIDCMFDVIKHAQYAQRAGYNFQSEIQAWKTEHVLLFFFIIVPKT